MDNANARMAKERNLADLPNPALARQNLQLGNSSTKNTGTTADTVAAGDDARITGAMQKNQNGGDIPDVAKFLQNLGFTKVGRDIIAGGTASDVLAYLGVPNLLNGKQDADNTLTALARLAGEANKLPYFSGPDVMSMTDFSDIGRAIIAASDKPSVLSYLELTTLGQALVKGGTASDILRTLGFNNGNGWYRIGEILIQFGHIPFAATSVPVTFPIPFPVVIDQIIVSDAGYASGNTWGATDRTQLGFTAQTNSTGQGGQYFAIGR